MQVRLEQDTAGEIKAVLVVQVDTASGVANDIAAIRRAIDSAGSNALYMVDAIASLATMPFEMDGWGIDVAVTGSQKGLMMTPGLSFNGVGTKALEAHKSADLRTHYWDWTAREGEEHYQKYCGTPPEHMLFGLAASLDLLLEEGLDNVARRHRILADAVHAAISVWAEGGVIEFNIPEKSERAPSVTTVLMNGHNPQELRRFCEETLRCHARFRHRRSIRPGVSHRSYGICQRTDGAWYPRCHRSRVAHPGHSARLARSAGRCRGDCG